MGSSSGKVLPEPSKNGYFCLINSCWKQQAWLWRRRSERGASRGGISGVKESVHLEEKRKNPNAKFCAKFDPRITARLDGRIKISNITCQLQIPAIIKCFIIIRLAEVFETQHQVYFVLELATGGELLERVVTRGTFREQDSTKALMMLSSGVCYLHRLDFWTCLLGEQDGCSAEYLAPEMLARRPCSSTVDIWALGVITYILLSILPFDHSSQPRLFRAILRGSYSFHGDVSVTCFYNTCHSIAMKHPAECEVKGKQSVCVWGGGIWSLV
uniref:Protein kinase domain-containing protein n=1 Tax=Cyprinus carpio TaxID=7962 RepID=A0A8C2HPA1_CYPCA